MKINFVKLSEIAEIIDSLHKTPSYTDIGRPMVRVTDVVYGALKLTNTFKVSDEAFAEYSRRYKPKKGDIVITRVGSYGNTAYVEDTNFCLGQNTAAIAPKINPDYLYTALNSPSVKRQIDSAVVGAVQKTLSLKAINNLEIPRFGAEEESKIGGMRAFIDNKIDLNRRTNQTLEAMAQAIFKSWFVDFDPVKAKIAAKQDGRDPLRAAMCAISGKSEDELEALPHEQFDSLATTAGLFPDEMEESVLGEIPKGWKAGTFNHCCLRVESGGTPSRKESSYWNGSIPWLTSSEVRDVVVLDSKEKITVEGLEASSAKLWPHMTTVIAMYGATAGQVCLIAEEMSANQACCALIPLPEFKSFIFIAARRSIQQLAEKASGSAQQNLNKSLVANHAHIIPTKSIAEKFEKTTSNLLIEWIRNQKETVTLSSLRDALLPKLLSGELSVNIENEPATSAGVP